MSDRKTRRVVLYLMAILAVGFGIDWGFAYILEVHGGKREKKKPSEATP